MLIDNWSGVVGKGVGSDRRNPSVSEFLTKVPTREEQKLVVVRTQVAHPSVPSALLAKDPSADPVEVKTHPECLVGSSTGFPSQFHGAEMELVAGEPHGLEGLKPIARLQVPPAPPGLGILCSAACQAFFKLTS